MLRFIQLMFVLGLATAAVGRLEPYYIARPRSLSLAEALSAVEQPGERMVAIQAELEPGVKWYGAKYLGPFGDKYFDGSKKEIPLGKHSPTAGVPLFGAASPPTDKRGELLGHDVVAESTLGGERLMLSERSDVAIGDSTIKGGVSRRILSTLAADGSVWVLSDSHSTIGGLSDRQPDYTKAESEWASAKSHRGVLKRLREHDFKGTDFASIQSEYRRLYGDPAALDEAWLIDETDQNADGRGNIGWYYYVPLKGSEGRIWAQFPDDPASRPGADQANPAEIAGVWVPAGGHRFDRTQAGFPEGKVALVQTAGYDREKFVDRRWSEWWGRFTVFVGCAMVVVSALLFLGYKVATSPLETSAGGNAAGG
jgi:hypothetical protein